MPTLLKVGGQRFEYCYVRVGAACEACRDTFDRCCGDDVDEPDWTTDQHIVILARPLPRQRP